MKHFDSTKEKYNHIFKGAVILINFLHMHHPNFALEIINPKFFFTKFFYFFSSCEVHIRCFKNICKYIIYNNDENCDLFKL
jgi:hypothetical protein